MSLTIHCNDGVSPNKIIAAVAAMVANGDAVETICDAMYMTETELRSYRDIDIMFGNEHDSRLSDYY